MSIIRCEKHGHWDSDFKEGCPLCELMGPQQAEHNAEGREVSIEQHLDNFLSHAEKFGMMSEDELHADINWSAAFKCVACGCLWRQHKDRTWSLYDETQIAGKCCDNTPEFLSLIRQVPAPSAPTAADRDALVKRLQTELRELIRQIDEFVAENGEASFYTGAALDALDLTAPAADGVVVPREIIGYLLGENVHPETGKWFGEPDERGAFLWRASLAALLTAASAKESGNAS